MSRSGRANLDAMLRHLAGDHDPQDFPSTAFERHALIETAGKRGLIAWQRDRRRYALTPAGWRRLRRGRGLGLASLAISAGAGAAIGAAALAVLWLPGDVSPRSAADAAASPSRVEAVGVLAPAPPPLAVTPVAAVAGEGAASAVPANPPEPPTAAESPAPKPSDAEAAPTAIKPPAARKSRHRTAAAHRRSAWDAARRYRDERFAGAGRVLR
jgi:hypothetical protein